MGILITRQILATLPGHPQLPQVRDSPTHNLALLTPGERAGQGRGDCGAGSGEGHGVLGQPKGVTEKKQQQSLRSDSETSRKMQRLYRICKSAVISRGSKAPVLLSAL